jgi:hypothetical protein
MQKSLFNNNNLLKTSAKQLQSTNEVVTVTLYYQTQKVIVNLRGTNFEISGIFDAEFLY